MRAGRDLQARFMRIKARHGSKKAAVVVAAPIPTAAYRMLREGTDYRAKVELRSAA